MSFWKDNKSTLDFLRHTLLPYKKMVIIYAIWNGMDGFFAAILPFLAKLEIDQLAQKHSYTIHSITVNPVGIFAIVVCTTFLIKLIQDIIRRLRERYTRKQEELFDKTLVISVYEKICDIQLGHYLNNRIKKIIDDTWHTPSTIIRQGKMVFSRITSYIGFFTTFILILSFIDFWILIVIVASSLISYGISRFVSYLERVNQLHKELDIQHDDWRMRNELELRLDKLITSGWQNFALQVISETKEKTAHFDYETGKIKDWLNTLSDFQKSLLETILKILIGYAVLKGTQSIGTMTMVLWYLSTFGSKISDIFDFRETLRELRVKIRQLGILLALTSRNTTPRISELSPPSTIRMQNISFSYPKSQTHELEYYDTEIKEIELRMKTGKDWAFSKYQQERLKYLEELREDINTPNPQVIHSADLTFSAGNVYGLVWKNGSGKTTLMYLLQNYFDEYAGSIHLDATETKDVSPQWFHKNVWVVHQEPYIIAGISIRHNLLLGVQKDIPDTLLYEYLDAFHLGDKVRKLSTGLETPIGERTDFSGGQKQLLVLIRVLLQDRPILILDEGTNQLDADNELMVMDELLKNKHEKIIIFITHRMTTMRKADYIYCLEDGTITDAGTHPELLAKDTVYARFWKKQVEA